MHGKFSSYHYLTKEMIDEYILMKVIQDCLFRSTFLQYIDGYIEDQPIIKARFHFAEIVQH